MGIPLPFIVLTEIARQVLGAAHRELVILDVWGDKADRYCWIEYEDEHGLRYQDGVFESWIDSRGFDLAIFCNTGKKRHRKIQLEQDVKCL